MQRILWNSAFPLVSLVLLMVAAGCGPRVPEQLKYRIVLKDCDPLRGSRVTEHGQPVGEVDGACLINFSTPSTVRPGGLELGLLVSTVCGERPLKIKLSVPPYMNDDRSVADSMANGGFILLDGTVEQGAFVRAPVLIDRPQGDTTPLRVGDQTLPRMPRAMVVGGGDCPASAPVRLGEEVIGVWQQTSGATLISVEPAVCHRLTQIGFGEAVAGMAQVFRQRVRTLERAPDHFLEAAPTSLTVGQHDKTAYRTELVRTECPTGPSFAEVGAERAGRKICSEAVFHLRRAVEFDQQDLPSWVTLLGCLDGEAEALTTARQALALNPEAKDALAAALRSKGHTGAADTLAAGPAPAAPAQP